MITTTPIQISEFRQCLAVDPADPTGVWLWSPGRSGCSSRSTALVFGIPMLQSSWQPLHQLWARHP
ncbi:MAG: hypothetical protein A3H97_14805 [Acidobacteria bacterium RIFCSPLOWO2_02_FULL_65_29]|nr:MAG: hypothetical protein A3H97_14805 [Acidobacteria bacterium RIFCSPLOWO2_02_FULL_65_29]